MQASYIAKRFQSIYRLTKINISRRYLLTLDKNDWFYVNYSQSQNLTMSRFDNWHFLTRFDDSGPELLILCQPFWKSKLICLLTRFDTSKPDLTIRDQNCWFCVNLSQSQNFYGYWPDLTFLDQIWRFGTRIVDSTQTPNQQSGWSVFFPEWQSPFWRPESTKWVPESTKWVPESTKGDPESTKGDPESTKWESQKQQIGSRELYVIEAIKSRILIADSAQAEYCPSFHFLYVRRRDISSFLNNMIV